MNNSVFMNLPDFFGDDCIFTNKELENSPSRKDGISEEEEAVLSVDALNYLATVGHLLDFHYHIVNSAMVLFHRFFAVRSFRKHDRFMIALVSLFIISKSEETKTSPRRFIVAHLKAIGHKDSKEEVTNQSEIYKKILRKILFCERTVLKTLSFVFFVEQPNLHLLFQKELAVDRTNPAILDFHSTSAKLFADSFYSDVCLRYPLDIVMLGAVYLAAAQCDLDITGITMRIKFDKVFGKIDTGFLLDIGARICNTLKLQDRISNEIEPVLNRIRADDKLKYLREKEEEKRRIDENRRRSASLHYKAEDDEQKKKNRERRKFVENADTVDGWGRQDSRKTPWKTKRQSSSKNLPSMNALLSGVSSSTQDNSSQPISKPSLRKRTLSFTPMTDNDKSGIPTNRAISPVEFDKNSDTDALERHLKKLVAAQNASSYLDQEVSSSPVRDRKGLLKSLPSAPKGLNPPGSERRSVRRSSLSFRPSDDNVHSPMTSRRSPSNYDAQDNFESNGFFRYVKDNEKHDKNDGADVDISDVEMDISPNEYNELKSSIIHSPTYDVDNDDNNETSIEEPMSILRSANHGDSIGSNPEEEDSHLELPTSIPTSPSSQHPIMKALTKPTAPSKPSSNSETSLPAKSLPRKNIILAAPRKVVLPPVQNETSISDDDVYSLSDTDDDSDIDLIGGRKKSSKSKKEKSRRRTHRSERDKKDRSRDRKRRNSRENKDSKRKSSHRSKSSKDKRDSKKTSSRRSRSHSRSRSRSHSRSVSKRREVKEIIPKPPQGPPPGHKKRKFEEVAPVAASVSRFSAISPPVQAPMMLPIPSTNVSSFVNAASVKIASEKAAKIAAELNIKMKEDEMESVFTNLTRSVTKADESLSEDSEDEVFIKPKPTKFKVEFKVTKPKVVSSERIVLSNLSGNVSSSTASNPVTTPPRPLFNPSKKISLDLDSITTNSGTSKKKKSSKFTLKPAKHSCAAPPIVPPPTIPPPSATAEEVIKRPERRSRFSENPPKEFSTTAITTSTDQGEEPPRRRRRRTFSDDLSTSNIKDQLPKQKEAKLDESQKQQQQQNDKLSNQQSQQSDKEQEQEHQKQPQKQPETKPKRQLRRSRSRSRSYSQDLPRVSHSPSVTKSRASSSSRTRDSRRGFVSDAEQQRRNFDRRSRSNADDGMENRRVSDTRDHSEEPAVENSSSPRVSRSMKKTPNASSEKQQRSNSPIPPRLRAKMEKKKVSETKKSMKRPSATTTKTSSSSDTTRPVSSASPSPKRSAVVVKKKPSPKFAQPPAHAKRSVPRTMPPSTDPFQIHKRERVAGPVPAPQRRRPIPHTDVRDRGFRNADGQRQLYDDNNMNNGRRSMSRSDRDDSRSRSGFSSQRREVASPPRGEPTVIRRNEKGRIIDEKLSPRSAKQRQQQQHQHQQRNFRNERDGGPHRYSNNDDRRDDRRGDRRGDRIYSDKRDPHWDRSRERRSDGRNSSFRYSRS
eukprot:TRINITY_DN55_c0_g3_i1.p1 TRINITY_DN55_c0_g3~~TRINITY_DN55_c0_g3_i1.p1  ORF type:complete len:1469 (+),score=471.95 TRINITY_DN55_c0_g3_i1:73-4479(+)